MDVPDDVWSVADSFLFDGGIMKALKHLTDVGGLSLRDAIDAVGERVTFLKANHPERFTVPLETYGEGIYT